MIITYKTQLTQKTQLTPDVFLYKFKLVEPSTISFIPGQYVILFVPQEKGGVARRLYSIASPNTLTNEFELLIKLVPQGCASCYFEKLETGSEVTFQGPAGMFILRESIDDKIFMVTGTGYAPIRSMLLSNMKNMKNQGAKTHLFIGFPYYKDIFLLDELKSYILQVSGFDFNVCLSREQNLDMISEEDKKYFLLGRVTNGFDQLLSANYKLLTNSDFYLCSGREIVEQLKQYVYEKGAPKERVYFEKF